MKALIGIFLLFIIASCHGPVAPADNAAIDSMGAAIQSKEQASTNQKETTDTLGELVTTISFEVKTSNLKDYPGGIIPYASIEKATDDIPNLMNKDKVVIHDTTIRVIIDYPLNKPCTFRLSSASGFTTSALLAAISKQYYLVYEEEEKTATIKTLPMKKRKMYNRNETNGKYGIWT